ncbi:MAG: type VI secretion system protein TssA [Candidatus Kapaibacterium sp.]
MNDSIETGVSELLLAPISEEMPAGESLRYEGTYDRIKAARHEDADLPMGMWETDLKRADWGLVETLCTEALEKKTKDIQIAIWLLEARITRRGYAGVLSGLRLINALCERFWDDLHPEFRVDDPEFRLAPFEWMNEKLSMKIGWIPITRPASPDGTIYNLFDLQKAQNLENLAIKNPSVINDAIRDGGVTMAKFTGSLLLTSDEFYTAMEVELRDCLEQLTMMELFLRAHCGADAPSVRLFVAALQDALTFVGQTLRLRGAEPAPRREYRAEQIAEHNNEVNMPDAAGVEQSITDDGIPRLLIRNRAEAYGMLSMIADYLTNVEPHSPTPYLIRRAVTWGSMPLAELLQELTGDGGNLVSAYKLLGIRDRDDR